MPLIQKKPFGLWQFKAGLAFGLSRGGKTPLQIAMQLDLTQPYVEILIDLGYGANTFPAILKCATVEEAAGELKRLRENKLFKDTGFVK